MMISPLPLPPHFHADSLDQVFRVDYEQRARDALDWTAIHNLKPADSDERRVCLLAIDVQNTFCIPEFELFVGGRSGHGAVDDNKRLCEFVYRNLGAISRILPTLDTHQTQQIFHATFLIDAQGRHPAPYTLVSTYDIASGRWRFNQAIASNLGLASSFVQRHLAAYTEALNAQGKYSLTIWPYHALLGGIGHALVSAVEEAIFFHGIARASQPNFTLKGTQPLTEFYSALGPEVMTDPDGKAIASKNTRLIEELLSYDAIVIAGQAKSHCVAWTIQDLLDGIRLRDSRLANKVYLLDDCSSPVVVPGALDYTDQAEAAYKTFQQAGMHVVHSTDPIATWPGLS